MHGADMDDIAAIQESLRRLQLRTQERSTATVAMDEEPAATTVVANPLDKYGKRKIAFTNGYATASPLPTTTTTTISMMNFHTTQVVDNAQRERYLEAAQAFQAQREAYAASLRSFVGSGTSQFSLQCLTTAIELVDKAKYSLRLLMYRLTDTEALNALVRACQRIGTSKALQYRDTTHLDSSMHVTILLDDHLDNAVAVEALRGCVEDGICTLYAWKGRKQHARPCTCAQEAFASLGKWDLHDHKELEHHRKGKGCFHPAMHSKMLVVDDAVCWTGSCNFSKASRSGSCEATDTFADSRVKVKGAFFDALLRDARRLG